MTYQYIKMAIRCFFFFLWPEKCFTLNQLIVYLMKTINGVKSPSAVSSLV